jgi:hypothetical protein
MVPLIGTDNKRVRHVVSVQVIPLVLASDEAIVKHKKRDRSISSDNHLALN